MSKVKSKRRRPTQRSTGKAPGKSTLTNLPTTVVGCACLLVSLLPLAFNPAGFFIFLPVKWTLALVLVGIGISAAILWRLELPRRTLVHWIPLLIVVTASTVWSVSWPTSLLGSSGRYLGLIAWFAFAGAFLLGTVVGSDEASKHLIVRVSTIASIVVSTYALAQAAGLDLFEWREGLDVSRSRSTFGSATFLGAYLVLILPVSLRLAFDAKLSSQARLIFAAAAALNAGALITTRTRGAWLGAAGSLVMLALLERKRIRARLRIAAGSAALAAALLVAVAALTPIGDRLASIANLESGTVRGRLIQWDLTLEMIADRPALGWGPDTYLLVFPRYVTATFEREVGRVAIPDRAHNVVLDTASTLGVLGLLALVWLVVSVFRSGLKPPRTAIRTALVAALVGYLVQMLFSFPLADLDAMFWLFAGLTVATSLDARTIHKGWGYFAAALTVAVGIWAIRDPVADVRLRRGLEYEARGRTAQAKGELASASEAAPERVQYLQASARFKRREGERSRNPHLFSAALREIERAETFSPANPEFTLDRADVLLAWGQVTGDPALLRRAERAFRQVLSADPNSSRALLRLGVAHVELGRQRDAERAWLRAHSLAPKAVGPILNLALLFEQQGRADEALDFYRKVLRLEPHHPIARTAVTRLRGQ